MNDSYKVEEKTNFDLNEHDSNNLSSLAPSLYHMFDQLLKAVTKTEYIKTEIYNSFQDFSLNMGRNKSLIKEFMRIPLDDGGTIFDFFLVFLQNDWDIQMKVKCITVIDRAIIYAGYSFFDSYNDEMFHKLLDSFLSVFFNCPTDHSSYPQIFCNLSKIFMTLSLKFPQFAYMLYQSPYFTDFAVNFQPKILFEYPKTEFDTLFPGLIFLIQILGTFMIHSPEISPEIINPFTRIITSFYDLPDDCFEVQTDDKQPAETETNHKETNDNEGNQEDVDNKKVDAMIVGSPSVLGRTICYIFLSILNQKSTKDFVFALQQSNLIPLIVNRLIYQYSLSSAMDVIAQALIDDSLAPLIIPLIDQYKIVEMLNFQSTKDGFESHIVLLVNYLNCYSDFPEQIGIDSQFLYEFVLKIFEQRSFDEKRAASFLFLIVLSIQELSNLDSFFTDSFANDLFDSIIESGDETILKALGVFGGFLNKARTTGFEFQQSIFMSHSIPQFLEQLIERSIESEDKKYFIDFAQQAKKMLDEFYSE